MLEQNVGTQEAISPELQLEIETAFDNYWTIASAEEASSLESDELEHIKELALKRELGFASKVTSATVEMSHRHEGPVVLLFDVDETIARNKFNENNSKVTYVRPAFAPTIKALRDTLGDKLEIGLLTSRGESHLDQELASPTYLAGVREIVNPDFVLSSRVKESKIFKTTAKDLDGEEYEDWDYDLSSLEYSDRTEEILAYCGDILKPEIVKEISEQGYSSSYPSWWNIKLGILHKIAAQHPERAFVFVEDLWCADSVREDHPQVMGVRVYEDAGFFSI